MRAAETQSAYLWKCHEHDVPLPGAPGSTTVINLDSHFYKLARLTNVKLVCHINAVEQAMVDGQDNATRMLCDSTRTQCLAARIVRAVRLRVVTVPRGIIASIRLQHPEIEKRRALAYPVARAGPQVLYRGEMTGA